MLSRVLACSLALLSICANALAVPITLETLLDEMTDRDALASFPSPEFTLKQESSWDRRMQTPDDPETWFANGDKGQYLRVEENAARKEWVIMDHKGPGAITRMWTANTASRPIMRIYIDGDPNPVITADFHQFMNGIGEHQSGYLAFTTGQAGNVYIPIPFARACKITLDKQPNYYVISYRSYPEGTPVESITAQSYRNALLEISKTGESMMRTPDDPQCKIYRETGQLAKGESISLDLPPGQHVVRTLRLSLGSGLSDQAYRSTVVQMECDGQQTIWCPVSDLFGSGIGVNPYRDRYKMVRQDGTMVCWWLMPYSRSAKITILNLGSERCTVSLRAAVDRWVWDDRSMYFHASWRQKFPLKSRPFSDWNFVTIDGKGVYVGDTLTVMNPSMAWWGEGDEKIYLDDEERPSIRGTGTEDYYGYAWGKRVHYSTPFNSQPRSDQWNENNFFGTTTVGRVRVLDAMPFSKKLKFDMEVWHWKNVEMAFAVTTYWYARPGASSNILPQPFEASRAIPQPPLLVKIPGAIEFEELKPVDGTPNLVTEIEQLETGTGTWSNGTHLLVRATEPSDFIEFKIPAPDEKPKRITLFATKSSNYGVIQLLVNGQIAKEIDTYARTTEPTGEIDLGIFEPVCGNFSIRAVVIGSSRAAAGGHSFGLDCITMSQP